jgi:hypothetical protein
VIDARASAESGVIAGYNADKRLTSQGSYHGRYTRLIGLAFMLQIVKQQTRQRASKCCRVAGNRAKPGLAMQATGQRSIVSAGTWILIARCGFSSGGSQDTMSSELFSSQARGRIPHMQPIDSSVLVCLISVRRTPWSMTGTVSAHAELR